MNVPREVLQQAIDALESKGKNSLIEVLHRVAAKNKAIEQLRTLLDAQPLDEVCKPVKVDMEPAFRRCISCNRVGAWHCSNPEACGEMIDYFSAAQLQAAVAEERERCAKMCEANDDGQREDDRDIVWAHCCESCAAAIRSNE